MLRALEYDPFDELIGLRLKACRTKAGLSQQSLGALVGVTFQQIQKYERGMNRISASKLMHLCHALDVTPSFLLDDLPAAAFTQDKVKSMSMTAAVLQRLAIENPVGFQLPRSRINQNIDVDLLELGDEGVGADHGTCSRSLRIIMAALSEGRAWLRSGATYDGMEIFLEGRRFLAKREGAQVLLTAVLEILGFFGPYRDYVVKAAPSGAAFATPSSFVPQVLRRAVQS
jgi:transcriptional regulator with XRE-family HTH domain